MMSPEFGLRYGKQCHEIDGPSDSSEGVCAHNFQARGSK